MANEKRKLKGYVTVDGQMYGPADKIPAKVADLLGDHVWADADGSDGGGDEVDETSLGDSTVAKLREYAAEQGFDLGDATKKADVIAVIEAGIAARDGGGTGD